MLCEHANEQLISFAEGELTPTVSAEIETHLATCTTCQEDYAGIAQFRTMANTWHDEIVPAWKPAPIAGQDWLESLRLWFPTAASTAALAMATLIFVQLPDTGARLPVNQPGSANYENLPPLPQATQAAMVQSVMDGSREQRQEELQAILKILKAEMDRRTIDTQESLRYVISNQLQGQQELDGLIQQVEGLIVNPEVSASAKPLSAPANSDTPESMLNGAPK